MDQSLGNRKKHRYTVKDLTIAINGKNYNIFNINEYGVGFLIDAPNEIEIGTVINPLIGNGSKSVQVAGIPRHVSQFQPDDRRLFFRQGWVCGTEFTARDDLGGRKMLQEFIAEHMERDVEKSKK
jgi:hypothetical protein